MSMVDLFVEVETNLQLLVSASQKHYLNKMNSKTKHFIFISADVFDSA